MFDYLLSSFQSFLPHYLYQNNNKESLPTAKIAEVLLAAILQKKYKNDISNCSDYAAYDGSKLPYPAGMSSLHALSTYMNHGGDKTETIEKFIDLHLRSPEQLLELIASIDFLPNGSTPTVTLLSSGPSAPSSPSEPLSPSTPLTPSTLLGSL